MNRVRQMQYKYVIVDSGGNCREMKEFRKEQQVKLVIMQDLLNAGWTPLRETTMGGVGVDSEVGNAFVLVLLQKED